MWIRCDVKSHVIFCPVNAGFRVSIYSAVKDNSLSFYFHEIVRMFGEPRRIWKEKDKTTTQDEISK